MGNKNSIDKSYHKYDSSFKTSVDADNEDVNEKESCMAYYFNNSNSKTIGQTKSSSVVPVQNKCKYEKCEHPNCNYETCNQNCDVNKPKKPIKEPVKKITKIPPKVPPRKKTEDTDHLFTDSDSAECENLEDWVKN